MHVTLLLITYMCLTLHSLKSVQGQNYLVESNFRVRGEGWVQTSYTLTFVHDTILMVKNNSLIAANKLVVNMVLQASFIHFSDNVIQI